MATIAYLKYSDSLVTDATVQAKDPDGAHDAYTVDANFPLANAKATPIQKPTKITIPTGSDAHVHIQIDFGASSDFDLVVLAGHNLSSTATVEMYAGASLYPASSIGSMTWGRGTMFHKFSSTQSARYLMLDIDDANSDYSYVSIGLIMAGELTATSATIADNWNQVNRAVNIRNDGDWITPISRNLFNRKRFLMQFNNETEANFSDIVDLYDDLNQDTAPAFILPDSGIHYGFVGRFTDELDREYLSLNASGGGDELITGEIELIEDANPILLS